jgi:hypothetical protein
LIFIVHSLGGFIFKHAMVKLSKSADDIDRNIFHATVGAVFFGVPTQGMDNKDALALVANLPSSYTMSLHHREGGYRLRQQVHEQFRETFPQVKIFQFFEERKSRSLVLDLKTGKLARTGEYKLLVDPHSATSGGQWENAGSLEGDHSSMIKFSQSDDENYSRALEVISKLYSYTLDRVANPSREAVVSITGQGIPLRLVDRSRATDNAHGRGSESRAIKGPNDVKIPNEMPVCIGLSFQGRGDHC